MGGGTSFSMRQTMHAAYQVARMSSVHLSALKMFYLAPLGAARALGLTHLIGRFAPVWKRISWCSIRKQRPCWQRAAFTAVSA
jgi:cytosine/adenosine deaminase-related metal-dependent hydrolase